MAADIIAVPGDPLTDIDALREVDFVMKEGRVVRQGGGELDEPLLGSRVSSAPR
ncbi:MAG: hypothetical protein H0V09_09460 [Gemmatimonadetes bacterium]|nr:hypothetical protein [Gemmatimonadota bacterium]